MCLCGHILSQMIEYIGVIHKGKGSNMNARNMVTIGISVVVILSMPASVYSENESVTSADTGNPNNLHSMDSSDTTEDKHSESDKTEVSQQDHDISGYFEKTKNEILQGRKFSNQSTAVNALLTLISAYHHQDQNTLEQIFPVVKMKQFERLSSPDTRSQMLAAARQSIFCRIEIEDKPPEESDICAVFTSESPEKPIDQVWSFAYVEGAWRFAGSTSATDNWRTQAKQAETLTRNILQSEATRVETATAENESESQTGRADERLQNRKRLIAWWRFENDANDSAGSNHGSIHGNPAYVDGKLGQAICLDGDDYVDCGNADVLNFGTGDWTLSAWIKTTQTGTEGDDEQKNRGTIFANGGDMEGGIRIALILNETILNRVALVTDDNTNKVQATTLTAVNDGIWHHIVGMRNADKLRIYIDGKLDGTGFVPAGYDLSGVSQHHVYIGVITNNRDNSLYKHFVGLIDEVCVFTCALDTNSVNALYSGKDPVTVAEQAKVVTEPPSRTRQAIDDDTAKKIVGDWDATLEKLNRSFVITISRNTDGSLAANAFFEGPDGELTTLTFDEVTFANGQLRLQARSIQAIFEGTIKEDGLTIEGPWQQQGQALPLLLKRAVKVQGAEQTVQGQSQDQISSKSNVAMTLILILVLAGVVAVVILFVVKSGIRS